MTRALLPALLDSGDGHIVTVTSTTAFEAYPGGAGYMAAKHGQRAMLRALRLELLGAPVRVTEVAPGMVETEFSLVRFGGDAERAADVYRGLEPLRGADVADAIAYCVTRPAHVDIDYLAIKPAAQATAKIAHRRDEGD
jgi:NADP-dependent 3-hydroxy acid dehydrogenase YdfG